MKVTKQSLCQSSYSLVSSSFNTVGVGLVNWLGYVLPELIRQLPDNPSVTHFVLLSKTSWVVSQRVGIVLSGHSHVCEIIMHDWVHLIDHSVYAYRKNSASCHIALFFRSKTWAVLWDQNPQFRSDHGPWSSWGPLLKTYGKQCKQIHIVNLRVPTYRHTYLHSIYCIFRHTFAFSSVTGFVCGVWHWTAETGHRGV